MDDTRAFSTVMADVKKHTRELYRKKLEAGLEFGVGLTAAREEAERFARTHMDRQVKRVIDQAVEAEEAIDYLVSADG